MKDESNQRNEFAVWRKTEEKKNVRNTNSCNKKKK